MTPAAVRSLIVALGIVLAGCGATPILSPAPIATPGASLPDASANPIDEAECALERQPGPDDRPPGPGGDGVDLSDRGGGRWRLCLDAPVRLAVEGSAWCTWNDERMAVSEASGLPLDIGNGRGTIDGSVSIEQGEVYLSQTKPAGEVGGWQGGPPGQLIQPSGDGSSGVARFRVAALLDPEHPPAIRPPDQVGTIRWACGDPPPHRPGRSTGSVDLHLDQPIDRTFRVAAACDWVATARGPRLYQANTYPPDLTFNDRFVGVSVVTDQDPLALTIWVDEHDRGATYQSQGADGFVSIRMPGNAASGSARFRHAPIDEGSPVRLAPGLTTLSGIVGWSCPQPVVPGPPAQPGQLPPVDPEGRESVPGRATLTFDPAIVGPVEGAFTCILDTTDPAYLRVSEMDGEFQADGRRITLRSNGGEVLLALTAADGTPHGEYVGAIHRIGDQADVGPLLLEVPSLVFEPTDPRYIPLGGPDGPRNLALHVDFSCQL